MRYEEAQALPAGNERSCAEVTALREVRYDPGPMHAALLALRGDYPVAAYIANRMRPPDAEPAPEQRLDFIRFRWGDAPAWWEQRDELPAWRALRGNGQFAD